MSHEVYQLENGKASMAYTGIKPWTGLGQDLTKDADVDTWKVESGLDWIIKESPVEFRYTQIADPVEFEGQKVLFRSDNAQPLSVVSTKYKTFQPYEVLEFFRKFVEAGDMTLETAGSLNGGRKIWALARIGEDFEVSKGDKVHTYTLLASSCDHSISSTGLLTSQRVVCANTLNMALRQGKSAAIRVPHSTKFDHKKVQVQMGLIKESIHQNANIMSKMAKVGVNDEQAMRFFIELLKTPEEKRTGKVDLTTKRRAIPKIWNSYKGAPGAEDTVWGLVNAVTHSVDYNPHSQSDSSRLDSAWFGRGAAQKTKAYEMASDENILDAIVDNTQKNQTSLDRLLATVSH